jgi:hypothetical protein
MNARLATDTTVNTVTTTATAPAVTVVSTHPVTQSHSPRFSKQTIRRPGDEPM